MVLIMGIVMPVSMATIQTIGKLGYTGLTKVIFSVLTENANDALNEANMEKIIDYVKKSIDELKMKGGEPSKLQMNMATFYMMLEEMDNLNDVVAVENLGRITYFVCGLAFEERNDIAKETVFIVS